MKVLVYVEGPSDRSALEALLAPVIARGQRNGVGIRFLQLGGKAAVLNSTWFKAAEDLARDRRDWMFALPDLYPMRDYDGTEYAHRSVADLRRVLVSKFNTRADRLGLDEDTRRHFRVHGLKHDLEALVLAAQGELRRRLKTSDSLRGRWREPVENQNDNRPPKVVVKSCSNSIGSERNTTRSRTRSGS